VECAIIYQELTEVFPRQDSLRQLGARIDAETPLTTYEFFAFDAPCGRNADDLKDSQVEEKLLLRKFTRFSISG